MGDLIKRGERPQRQETTELDRAADIITPDAPVMLDPYAAGEVPLGGQLDALATISAGRKVKRGNGYIPQVSRDGTIYIHDPEGRAPGLAEALKEQGGKRLIIAFPSHDWQGFVQQRFARYSASRLEGYGDAKQFTVIGPKGERMVYPAGTPEYEMETHNSKNAVSVYFFLARWGGEDIQSAAPQIYFPDGFGVYRLRFTSRNSLRNLLATIRELQGLTAGRIAGVPLELRLVYREVADPTGARRRVPVWTFTLKPPGQLALTNETFRVIVQRGLEAGESLKLEALEPPSETLEDMEQALLRGELLEEPVPVESAPKTEPKAAAMDAEFERLGREPEQPAVLEPDEKTLEQLATGYVPETWTRNWFAAVEGTPYRDDAGRAWLISDITDGEYDSLAAVIKAGEETAQAVYDATLQAVERWRLLTANIRAIAEESDVYRAAVLDCLKGKQPYDLAVLSECLEAAESLKRANEGVGDAEQQPLIDG